MDTSSSQPVADIDDDLIPHHGMIGAAMGRWRMLIGRRVLSRLAISTIAPSLELSHLDVLDTVRRGAGSGEVTVGAIAEAMRIDPSRASRIVTDMVARGALQRQASQADARRITLVLTDLGNHLMEQVQQIKKTVIRDVLADWSHADVESFARLFDTFVTGFEQVIDQETRKYPAETAAE